MNLTDQQHVFLLYVDNLIMSFKHNLIMRLRSATKYEFRTSMRRSFQVRDCRRATGTRGRLYIYIHDSLSQDALSESLSPLRRYSKSDSIQYSDKTQLCELTIVTQNRLHVAVSYVFDPKLDQSPSSSRRKHSSLR